MYLVLRYAQQLPKLVIYMCTRRGTKGHHLIGEIVSPGAVGVSSGGHRGTDGDW